MPNAAWIAASTFGRSTFSASILLTMTRRHSRRFAAQSIIRDAIISSPDCALTTTAAVSTASSAPIACPMKSGKPGVSIRWMRVSGVSRCRTDERSECCHVFSSGSKSLTVVPRSTVPASLIAPVFEQQRLGERGLARRRPGPRARRCGCSRWRNSPCESLLRRMVPANYTGRRRSLRSRGPRESAGRRGARPARATGPHARRGRAPLGRQRQHLAQVPEQLVFLDRACRGRGRPRAPSRGSRCFSAVRDVIMMIGMCACFGSPLIVFVNSKPSIRGISMSSRITSGVSVAEQLERVDAVLRGDDVEALAGEQPARDLAHRQRVVDDHDQRRRRPARRRASAHLRRDRRVVRVAARTPARRRAARAAPG